MVFRAGGTCDNRPNALGLDTFPENVRNPIVAQFLPNRPFGAAAGAPTAKGGHVSVIIAFGLGRRVAAAAPAVVPASFPRWDSLLRLRLRLRLRVES